MEQNINNPQIAEDRATVVVGIGASAGGLRPLKTFFNMMPTDSGCAFVIVQHLSPDFKSLMGELLATHTSMTIMVAVDGVLVEPNKVYLIPPRNEMVIMNGRLYLNQVNVDNVSLFLPINTFFMSLAREMEHRAVAVIFSGAGSDGTRGIQEIDRYNGLVLVQDKQTAQFTSMIESVENTAVTFQTLNPEQMPQAILNHIKQLHDQDHSVLQTDGAFASNNGFVKVLQYLQSIFDTYFGEYKMPMLVRRIERRMGIANIESPIAYLELLKNDREEAKSLYREIMVNVTQFMRDPQAFEWLAENTIPQMVREATEESELRIWIPACASGEEAYTLAILFFDEIIQQQKTVRLKIFATDIHPDSIRRAVTGVYSSERIKALPHLLVDKYFIYEDDSYRVDKAVRSAIIFTQHNLLVDPLFTNLDMISCRNLLIYLLPDSQKRLLAQFHFALKKNGILLLGAGEHLGDLDQEFRGLNREWRIFQKKGIRNITERLQRFTVGGARRVAAREPTRASTNLREKWESPLFELLAGDCVLLNDGFQLIRIFGKAARYLEFSAGPIMLEISQLLHKPLQLPIRTALVQAKEKKESVVFHKIRLDELDLFVRVVIDPVPVEDRAGSKPSYFIVRFYPVETASAAKADGQTAVLPEEGGARIVELEEELSQTRESLQITLAEIESTNQQLQMSNEELMSSNEELQSVNEELQSVNEELYSVNTEYMIKNQELNNLHNDMLNLQRSSGVMSLFLDKKLNIRSFTPEIMKQFRFLSHDVGRSILHLLAFISIDEEALQAVAQEALQGEKAETEVFLRQTQQLLSMKVMPFTTELGQIEGVVLHFTDITALRTALSNAEHQIKTINNNIPAWISYIDSNFVVQYANHYYEHTFHRPIAQIVGFHIKTLIGDIPFAHSLPYYKRALAGEQVKYQNLVPTKDGEQSIHANLQLIPDEKEGEIVGFYVLGFDNSRVYEMEEKLDETTSSLEKMNRRIAVINNSIPAWISYINDAYQIEYANKYYEETFDVPLADIPSKHLEDVLGKELFAKNKPLYDRALAGETVRFQRRLPKGVSARVNLIPDKVDDDVVGFFVIGVDIQDAFPNDSQTV